MLLNVPFQDSFLIWQWHKEKEEDMVIVIATFILDYLIEAFLVGVSFFALKERFQWHISERLSLAILFMIFAFLEVYILPTLLTLDLTYTVGNAEIAEFLDLKPNSSFAELFGFGFYEIIIWSVQVLLAAFFGLKIIQEK